MADIRTDFPGRRSSGWGYLLWLACLAGVCGLHRFYARKYVSGFIWLFTFGLLGVGQFVDLFLINGMVRDANREAAWDAAEDAVLRRAAYGDRTGYRVPVQA